jgi:hypothetical protein
MKSYVLITSMPEKQDRKIYKDPGEASSPSQHFILALHPFLHISSTPLPSICFNHWAFSILALNLKQILFL